jgi:hypothetical protein
LGDTFEVGNFEKIPASQQTFTNAIAMLWATAQVRKRWARRLTGNVSLMVVMWFFTMWSRQR